MSYKRFYLIGSVSLLAIFALIAPFIEYYYGYDNVVYCTDNCIVDFCLKNGAKDLYFYNKDSLPLTFEPEGRVNDVKFYKKDGRFKSGYRLIDFIEPYSAGVKYVFKIDAYKTACYRMEITKKSWADVKWTFMGLDPMLLSGTQIGDKLVKEDCEPIYSDIINKTIYYKTIKGQTFPNGTITKDTQVVDYIESKVIGEEQTDCIKTGKVTISGKTYEYKDYFCKLEGKEIVCIHQKEGGQYNSCKLDGSVTCFKIDTDSEEQKIFYNSLRTTIK